MGLLADKYSKKVMITLSMLLCGAASIFISVSQGLLGITASFIALGIGTSLYHLVGYSLVSVLSGKRRGRYMGIQGLGGNVA